MTGRPVLPWPPGHGQFIIDKFERDGFLKPPSDGAETAEGNAVQVLVPYEPVAVHKLPALCALGNMSKR
jgi:hypothetical protein